MKLCHLKQWLSNTIAVLVLTCQSTTAQIVPDTTLQNNSTVREQNNTNIIEGGIRAGNNIFHSFQEFSIPNGNITLFNNPLDIQNILTRVTGNKLSNINGLIRANGSANLFLINPNGIFLGPNAKLDIGGSFIASTANKINFVDGVFSAIPEQSTPLLSIATPIGLQYGNNPGNIQVEGSSLQMQAGQTLAMVGGDVSIDGGSLLAMGGRVELGGVTGGTVGLNLNAGGFVFPDGVARGNVSLVNRAFVDVSSNGEGNIAINASNLNMSGASELRSGISGAGSLNNQAGSIKVNATEAITIALGSKIANEVMENSVGNAGNIDIIARFVSLSDSAQLSTGTQSLTQGNAGTLNINTDSISVRNGSFLASNIQGKGNSGNININARDNVLFDGAWIYSDISKNGVGKGGDINISTGFLDLKNNAQLIASTNNQGNAGNIFINSGSVSLLEGSFFAASANGQGNGGDITINARDFVSFDRGSRIYTDVAVSSGSNTNITQAIGNGGNINISANNLTVINDSFFATSTQGVGNSGNVNINLSGNAFFLRGWVFTDVTSSGIGRGGDINITANLVDFRDGGQLVVSTKNQGDAGNIFINAGSVSAVNDSFFAASANGQGNAGDITINARDSVLFNNGSQAYTDVNQFQAGVNAIAIRGDGGNITINTELLDVRNGSQLVANTYGEGDAGNLIINAGSVYITNGAFLTSSTNGQGNAGNITINARQMVEFDKGSTFSNVGFCQTSDVGCSTSNNSVKGNGGNININAPSLKLINNSFLATGIGDNFPNRKASGHAGNISLNIKDNLFLYQSFITSKIFANGIGKAGNIDIQANSISLFQSLISASTQGQGDAGGISLQAIDSILLDDSDISTAVQTGAIGDAQEINIIAQSLALKNGAQLNAVTSGDGNAGNINIDTSKNTSISGTNAIETPTNLFFGNIPPRFNSFPEFVDGISSGIFTSTNSSGSGGNITMNTDVFDISNGAVIDARTTAAGTGGGININANRFNANSGGQLTAITSSNGAAGNITLNVSDSIKISGQDSTYATRLAQFNNQTDIYGKPKVSNQGASTSLTVSSTSSGPSGNLQAQANSMFLSNGATISADTQGSGGNISLISGTLLLRQNSNITTNARGSNVIGGNITLNTDVIAAFENSDITANSVDFRGGNVNLNTQAIFGSKFRDALTPESDITATGASSELSGTVQINTPDLDPSSGLIELPVTLVDNSQLIAQSCPVKEGNQFIVTGRGGLPSLPSEPLRSSRGATVDWVDVEGRGVGNQRGVRGNIRVQRIQNPILEASSWVVNNQGEVILIAALPVTTVNNSSSLVSHCSS